MKPIRSAFMVLIVSLTLSQTNAQDLTAINDTICTTADSFSGNVLINDIYDDDPTGPSPIVIVTSNNGEECLELIEDGSLFLFGDDCCGEFRLTYVLLLDGAGGQPIESNEAVVIVKIECPKPDCSFIDLSDFLDGQPGGDCIDVCEGSVVTFDLDIVGLSSYNWAVSGGVLLTGQGTGTIQVQWPTSGTGLLTLTNYNGGLTFCINVLSKPTAVITGDTYVCLGNQANFSGASSIGATSYVWDFGDSSPTSTGQNVTHSYSNPGPYVVTLVTTGVNSNSDGSPSCCCVDTTSWNIVVDSLPGPPIYWVSTLCEGDKTTYWTDASCPNYSWSVSSNGTITQGQGTDSICVSWGLGPVGTVTLDVDPCAGYCTTPTTVSIPIIPSNADISGPTIVCVGSTEEYCVPKWNGTLYDWDVSSDGVITSSDTSHCVTINWVSAGPRVITVNYSNPFLQGLPSHSGADCTGSGSLNVDVRPKYNIIPPAPPVYCLNTTGNFSTDQAGNFNWTISPSIAFTGQGTSSISVLWNTSPGTYTISAVPTDSTLFCNNNSTIIVSVVDVPKPLSIEGANEICPGDSYYYQVLSSESGVTFQWSAVNGTPTSATGDGVNITWGLTGPYALSVSQSLASSPFCTSDTIQISPTPKLLLPLDTIAGSAVCTNSLGAYSIGPVQHPDASYSWSIAPSSAGSVVGGQGSSSITIQWNNLATSVTISVDVELCGNTLTQTKNASLTDPVKPIITTSGFLCSGGVTLCVNNVTVQSWSGGSTPTNSCTTVTSAGTYSVTTIDANGCPSSGSIVVNDDSGIIASISPSPQYICTSNGNTSETATIQAYSNSGASYVWYCNGLPAVPQPTNPLVFVHTETGIDSTYLYYVIITDNITGCSETSNTVAVIEYSPCGSPGGCDSIADYSLSFTTALDLPDCSTVNVDATSSSNVRLLGWDFGDPYSNVNNLTSLDPAQHTYSLASCYIITLYARVPRTVSGPPDSCDVSTSRTICVPVVADFDYSVLCKDVQFTQDVSLLSGEVVSSYQWDFGDSNNGTGSTVSHSYASGGVYLVTLTVTTVSGCIVTSTQTIVVPGDPPLGIIVNTPPPYCVGDPIQFTGVGGTIINWLWDFGDGSQNGSQSPQHTYLIPGNPFIVRLTGVDADGCISVDSVPLVVNPAPLEDTISYTSLSFCEGDSIQLIAPSCGGCTYLWNTGATTSSIWVNIAGQFSVLVTDANACSYTTDEVTTISLLDPDPSIFGDLYICDQGTTTLSAIAGYAAYLWQDGSNLTVGTTSSLTINSFSNNSPYKLTVTSSNGCTSDSSVVVTNAISPFFTVSISPDPCAGDPSTLTVVPVQSGVVYTWSNGPIGPSMTTSIAGVYYVTGTDTITGCSYTSSGTIYPLPDFCSIPVGCYEICAPDTICGPDGMASYQWLNNGLPMSGENGQCLIMTAAGAYSLIASTTFGCTDTSGAVIVEVLPCDSCELVGIGFELVTIEGGIVDSCCASLDYSNLSSLPLAGLQIRSLAADLSFNNLDPSFILSGSTTSTLDLIANPSSNPLPTGAISDFIEICVNDPVSYPQLVIVDWYDLGFEVVCSDTLTLYCPIEPDCLYLDSDSIYCEGLDVIYEMTLCNPLSSPWPVGYVDFQISGSILLSPPSLSLTSPILPGECRSFTFVLGGTFLPGDSLCYSIIAHDADPSEVDTALCCSTAIEHCIIIPDCDPCDDVAVNVLESDSCCVAWSISNNYQANYFDGIDICVLTSNTSISINNTFGSGWITSANTGTSISLDVAPPIGNFIGLTTYTMPSLCISTTAAPLQLVEIKWMQGDSTVCRDTLLFDCLPPCGYITDEVLCEGQGYFYSWAVTNTSSFVMDKADLVITKPTGTGIVQSVSLGSLNTGSTSSFFNIFLPPSVGSPGDTVCFTLALHEEGLDSLHINCCNIEHCFVLPECPHNGDCECDDDFYTAANSGFTITGSGNTIALTLTDFIDLDFDCDSLFIDWGDDTLDSGSAIASYQHNYGTGGFYTICVQVRRNTGFEVCMVEICKTIVVPWIALGCDVFDTAPVDLTKSFNPVPFPNGVVDRVQVKWYKSSPQISYSAADDAAIDIEFWPIRDLILNNPILDGDTSLIPMRTKPGQDFFKWPIKFERPDIQPNIRYSWRVRAHCQINDFKISPWSDIKVFNTPDFDPVTGVFTPPQGIVEKIDISKVRVRNEFQIYPNPLLGQEIFVKADYLKKPLTVNFRLTDIDGRLIIASDLKFAKDAVLKLDLDRKLNSGVYFVILESLDGTSTFKLLVNE